MSLLRARAAAALAAALGLFAPALGAVSVAGAQPASTDRDRTPAAVRLAVRRITPSAPLPSQDERPFDIELVLTNLTGTALPHVLIDGTRGEPIENRTALADSLTQPFPSTGFSVPIHPTHKIEVSLPADSAPHVVQFPTTTGIPNTSGICLCHEAAVYPLSFTATTVASDGTTQKLATAGTYMPAFEKKPSPVRVSWVWPLIDRPHRLADDRVFVDDSLASSVSFDGRLDRSLSVLEGIVAKVPVTVMVDPELIDELQVMASGKYSVQVGRHRVAGTGTAAAASWLARLRTLLQAHPSIELEATPYGDPDVQTLSTHDLSWHTAMPTPMEQRVQTALGDHQLDDDLVWPATGRLGSHAFKQLVDTGTRAALLNTSSITPTDGDDDSVPDGIARLSRSGKRIGVGLLDPVAQSDVATVVTRNRSGLSQLPRLMAEIAVRAAQDPTSPHNLVLAPPRYVDPNPAAAVHAIIDTSTAPFSSAESLADLLDPNGLPGHNSHLTKIGPTVPALPQAVIGWAHHVASAIPTVDSLLGGGSGPHRFRIGAAAATVLAALPPGLQRIESSFWVADPQSGTQFADHLADQVDAITNGVQIVHPKSGTYTLASSNSPLPVTVTNSLRYPVAVRLKVMTANGLPGFVARDIGAQQIFPRSQSTLKLPTSIARSGQIRIDAQLLTPTQQPLGNPVLLTVHSSAFGTVGVVITVVAGAVLVLALLLRALRWLVRRRRRTPSGPHDVSAGPTGDGPTDDALTPAASAPVASAPNPPGPAP